MAGHIKHGKTFISFCDRFDNQGNLICLHNFVQAKIRFAHEKSCHFWVYGASRGMAVCNLTRNGQKSQ